MALIQRGNLPTNYVDLKTRVDANLMLPTPEPQYLFAQMAMAGRLSLASIDAGATTVQQFVSMNGGGAEGDKDLARLMIVSEQMPNAVTAVDAFGLGLGDTVKFDRDVYSTGGLTEADREHTTGSTVSTTGLTITEEEIPVVLKQYMGPYDASGSGVQPYGISEFDAKWRANKEKLVSKVTRRLVRDYTYWLDTVIRLRYQASTYTTLSDADYSDVTEYVAGGNSRFTSEQLLRARQALVDRHWQPFPDGRYKCIVPTVFNAHMQYDLDYRDRSKNFADGRNLIHGYIGSFQDIDIYECATTTTWAAASTFTGTGTGTVPTSVTLEEGLLFGPGVVGMGTALSPETRFSDSTNYGLEALVIWYALHAFQTLDQRGVQRIVAQST